MLTDNEKTVTTEHIAGIPVRNGQLVTFAEHYSVVVHNLCAGGSGVQGRHRVVGEDQQADLVPKDTNLREEYASFSELEEACEAFCQKVNTRGSPGPRSGHRSRCWPKSGHGYTRSRHSRTQSRFGTTRVVAGQQRRW